MESGGDWRSVVRDLTKLADIDCSLHEHIDEENKGFISKRDMQRLQTELPLSPEQLEDVFDSLDDDGNGYLTRDEFTEGFGGFVGVGPSQLEKQTSMDSTGSTGVEDVYEERGDDEEGEEHFSHMMENIGVHHVIDDADTLKALWTRLRTDEPELLAPFEGFLGRVTTELKRTHQEHQTLETALRSKTSAHDEEIRKLYEEMEQQIKHEKDKILAEERSREKQLREELETSIMEKDTQLNSLLSNHSEIQRKLDFLNSQEFETKQENEKLLKEKHDLDDMLCQSQRNLDDSRSYINDLRQQQRNEKKERAMAAMKITEGIAIERESLVKQLDLLRDMNKKLRDDRDEDELRRVRQPTSSSHSLSWC